MSLFETIDSLEIYQLRLTADNLDISKKVKIKTILKRKINENLTNFYRSQSDSPSVVESFQVLSLWKDHIHEIINKKKVKDSNKRRKQEVLEGLEKLNCKKDLNDPDNMESITRDILMLLWKESSEKEKKKFRDIVREELEKYSIELTNSEIDKITRDFLLGSMSSATPFAIPIVSAIMLQQLTQGFIAWVIVSLLGQKALQAAVLSSLSGPIAWGLSIGAFSLGIGMSAIRYKSERNKLRFVQAILLIYAFSYQNRFNCRREGN
ncbi:hypothetical protein [Almyronema epifaneia]|uniref:Uncharacterized protein n=1 Tax=Almyronema epifaneia S1 TaxID=2991925 RepID=A0ABW6IHP8_9CYAN